MMEPNEKQALCANPSNNQSGKKLHIEVAGCTVTLNFSHDTQNALMTEVKRMILSGYAHAKI